MKSKLYFRVDANASIGRGHLSRCLALGEMLKEEYDIFFVVLKVNQAYIENLNINFSRKFVEDENGIFHFINDKDFVWLDGYQFTEDYKKRLKSKVSKLIETNDIPYEARNVDVIVNHTPGLEKKQFGKTTAQLYLGLKYALLRPSFLDFAKKRQTNTPEGKGVFVCFGGADIYNLGFKFVQRLVAENFTDPIYWIIQKDLNNNKLEDSSDNLQILSNLNEEDIIYYMLKSKVLLVPSSVLCFEAIALRKPFLASYFVENQNLIFEGLKKAKLAECFGYMETGGDVDLAFDLFIQYYANDKRQKQIIINQKLALDGQSKTLVKSILKKAS